MADDSIDYSLPGQSQQESLDLIGSTGKNDSSSPWFAGLISGVQSLGSTATGILGAVNKTGTKKTTPTNWVPFAVIGGAVLLLIVVLGAVRK